MAERKVPPVRIIGHAADGTPVFDLGVTKLPWGGLKRHPIEWYFEPDD